MGGRGDTLGQLLTPLTASLFSILALSWIRRRVNAKPGSAPSPCPPPQPACPCQPLLGSGALPPSALPGAVSQLSVPFPLPSPSAHLSLHPNPKRGDLQQPAPPGWRGGGCRQAPPPLCTQCNPLVCGGDGPPAPAQPQPPSPALPARGFGTWWGQRSPLAALPACGSGAAGTQGSLPYIHI